MKVLELFSGSKAISKAFKRHGHETFTVDWNPEYEPDLVADISQLSISDIIREFDVPDIIWASPDCTTYSIAGIGYHRLKNPITGELDPVSEYAKQSDETNKHVLELINYLSPEIWFIENPRGGLRKMSFMQGLPRYTVTYCQYGDFRMKPTDIWTNHPNPDFKPCCKNGDPCHMPSPRGMDSATQGMKNAYERAIIPVKLCEHIVNICEDYHNNLKSHF